MEKRAKKNHKRFKQVRLVKGAEKLLSVFLGISDGVVLNAVFLLVFSLWLKDYAAKDIHFEAYLATRYYIFGLYLVFAVITGLFDIRKLTNASEIFFSTTNSLLGAFVSFNLLIFLSRTIAAEAYAFPRPIMLIGTIVNILALFFLRVLITTIFVPAPMLKKAIIIGNKKEGKRIIRHFHRRGGIRFRLVKFLESSQINQLASEVIFKHAHEVLVTDSDINLDEFWASIFYQRKEAPHEFNVRVSIDPKKTTGISGLRTLEDFPLITINSFPLNKLQRILKRSFDVGFAFFAIIVSAPIMLAGALLVKMDSPGPLFYKQKRVGRYGKSFDLVKFRSMKVGSEAGKSPQIATGDDPRVTPIGRFIRRFGIDELPQFFLVLAGEMSIVGPRPERPFFVEKFLEFQGRRLSIKPGVTGLAAVNSRYYLKLTDKVTYDYYYLDNYSLLLDIKIVFQTIWVVLFETADAASAGNISDELDEEQNNSNFEDK